MPMIFVSYRRTDAPGHAGRLYDRLAERFGEANVFIDVDSTEPGADFVEVIEAAVGECDVLVAVIGPGWLGAKQGGARRLDDPRDLVRIEIASALARKIRVVPVLVHGGQMPVAAELPEDLAQLARRNAVHLTDTAWRAQVGELSDALEKLLERRPAISAAEPGERGSTAVVSLGSPVRPPAVMSVDWTAGVREVFALGASAFSAAFSPDGLRIASSAGVVWDAGTGRELLCFTRARAIWGVAFSRDCRRIATCGSDDTARIWDAHDGHELLRVTHETDVNAVVFSPDGRHIATASSDSTARIWDAEDGRELILMLHLARVRGVAFSPDGGQIATASCDGTGRVWRAEGGRELTRVTHRRYVNDVSFRPDGRQFATASEDSSARVWDAGTGREVTRLVHAADVRGVAFSPDGRHIATASDDKTARVWDADSGRELARMTRGSQIRSVAFSPDGRRIATTSADGVVVSEARA